MIYTREELIRREDGRWGWKIYTCALCGGCSLEGDSENEIKHDPACPFAWDSVFAIEGVELTVASADIFGKCAAKDRACIVPDWRACTHETLMKTCCRYAVDDDRRADPIRRPK